MTPATTFYEIVLISADFTHSGRDEIEDPLHEALLEASLGEVTGGGSGMGKSNIDVEVTDPEKGLQKTREILRHLGVAASTTINRYEPSRITFRVYEET